MRGYSLSILNTTCTLMKFHMPILEYVIEGPVSQIFHLGPSFYLSNVENKV